MTGELFRRIKETGNPSVAGLDPRLSYIPAYIKEAAFDKFGKTLEGAAEAIRIFTTVL